jgi:hypothetical protein
VTYRTYRYWHRFDPYRYGWYESPRPYDGAVQMNSTVRAYLIKQNGAWNAWLYKDMNVTDHMRLDMADVREAKKVVEVAWRISA